MSLTTRCRNIQLLEPDPSPPYDVTDLDESSEAVAEDGTLTLTEGITEYNVLFNTEKLSDEWNFTEDDITNEVDGDPLVIEYNFSNRTSTGFTLNLDSMPDSANYVFRWAVTVTEV